MELFYPNEHNTLHHEWREGTVVRRRADDHRECQSIQPPGPLIPAQKTKPRHTAGRMSSSGMLFGLQNVFEYFEIFLDLFFHLFFEYILIELYQVDRVCLHGQVNLRTAFGNGECVGCE